MQDNRLVYSTDGGKINNDNNPQASRSVNKDGIARIHRETKGRKGKGVSIITGLDKELFSKTASEIKSLKAVEPYKVKGIKEKDQYVLRKEGKKK